MLTFNGIHTIKQPSEIDCTMSDSNRLVFSTETGRIKEEKEQPVRPKGDGIVRIQRETKAVKVKVFVLFLGLMLKIPN